MPKASVKQASQNIKPSKSGPKTAKGRSAVSKNAITHGVTSTRLTTTDEATNYDQFIAELTDYYQPESPLESLQIERIAMLRAKLKHLYRVEGLQLEMASRAAENNLDQLFKSMPHIQGVTKGMLREMLTFGQTLLPCGLTPEVLVQILLELDSLAGMPATEDELVEALPNLAAYLSQVLSDKDHQSLLHRLVAVGEILKSKTSEGEYYSEFAKSLIKKKEKGEDILDEHAQELDRYLEEQQAKRNASKGEAAFKLNILLSNLMPDAKQVARALDEFKIIARAYAKALYCLDEALELYELSTQSVTLGAEEADRFLRYQTTLERRLSTAIGELLQMRKI